MAAVIFTGYQTVAHGNARIKNIALPIPFALRGGHVFQIFQNTTFQVINLGYPLAQQIVGRFFTPDSTRAKHRNTLTLEGGFVVFPPVREITKCIGFGINSAPKRAYRHFITVAGINQHNIGFGYQIIPIFGRDVLAHPYNRINVGLAHCDDFAL